MNISDYIESVGKRFALGNATEHTFRGDLQTLIESLVPGIAATNEPKRIACGAPDYVVTRKDIPLGYIEAKDIGEDLLGGKIKEQRDRYRLALDNLIYTDYLDFHLYRGGELKAKVRIAEIQGGKVVPRPESFDEFTSLIKEFASHRGQTIKSSKTLAEMMAEKAKMLAFIIHNALNSDEESDANSTLKDQMAAFKQVLIHDLDARSFADVYAQTIAYGMFAARLHDPSLESFSRREAAELIPKTNPFLRKLFNNIATDIDERIEWIVDALADVFRAADIAAILKNFGKSTQTHDPIMHFYETFLAAYDPKLRKSRGVFYTPEPVVDFIVRAVDDILKTEFGLPMGLADTSKTKIKLQTTVKDDRTKSGYREEEKEVHRVQILDPATGTGTFLAQVIKQIHNSFENQQGAWNQYVDEHLIPRLNGFELLMASYAMAHLKLDLLLTELGSDQSSPPYEGGVDAALGGRGGSLSSQRFRVYLTNALEEYHPETGTLWASWLSAEANEANHIKRDTPVMVVIGNPPYSVSSSNKSEWIEKLTADYKKDLNERNIQPLSDDYIKFIRFGQNFVDKNGEGILAYISNNGFIDGSIHRQMRKHLAESFDSIYIVNLHGNSNLKETHPDGGEDKNVFDIRQGVSINIFVKIRSRNKNPDANIYHCDIYGNREAKYEWLNSQSLSNIVWTTFDAAGPGYYFVPKNFKGEESFQSGFSIGELFGINSTGVKSHRDDLVISEAEKDLKVRIAKFFDLSFSDDLIRNDFELKDNADFKLADVRKTLRYRGEKFVGYLYRPFDFRYIYYETFMIDRAREKVMKNLLGGDNFALILPKQVPEKETAGASITRGVCDHKCFSAYNTNNVFPLYLYPDDDAQQTLGAKLERTPNLNRAIVGKMAEKIGLEFRSEPGAVTTGSDGETENHPVADAATPLLRKEGSFFAPIDILDYIYAVLHSPSYREKYKEFLKIDFPRVPYPKDAETFWQLVALGGEIRQIHLLESPRVEQFITGYPVGGSNEVVKPEYKDGKVFINTDQHFSGVPEIAWNFYIGGYQPAQKWLKDRKGRTLTFDDIRHYQKIIVALTETDRLMKEIDKIDLIEAA